MTVSHIDQDHGIGVKLRAKLYTYPYRIAESKLHLIIWNFDKEALDEIAKDFKSKSVLSVEIKEKTLVPRAIEEPVS